MYSDPCYIILALRNLLLLHSHQNNSLSLSLSLSVLCNETQRNTNAPFLYSADHSGTVNSASPFQGDRSFTAQLRFSSLLYRFLIFFINFYHFQLPAPESWWFAFLMLLFFIYGIFCSSFLFIFILWLIVIVTNLIFQQEIDYWSLVMLWLNIYLMLEFA